jgi:myo-inositol-1-phosphate synthase
VLKDRIQDLIPSRSYLSRCPLINAMGTVAATSLKSFISDFFHATVINVGDDIGKN